MLVARNCQPSAVVRLLPERIDLSAKAGAVISGSQGCLTGASSRHDGYAGIPAEFVLNPVRECRPDPVLGPSNPSLNELLYVVACQVEWEKWSDTGAAWEVISATRSPQENMRAHALSLLEHSDGLIQKSATQIGNHESTPREATEAGMRTPYGLEIIESCMGCKASREGFFCRFSAPVMRAVDTVSHHTVMPSEALIFVEGQAARGIFVLCSGKVKLSTTSKDGKVLILKQAEAGEVLGLSAAISGTSYEVTAETTSSCQLNFIGRSDFMALLQNQAEVGVHAAMWLSREFQGAYRDIHDLVLARSSSGKLARLLLSCVSPGIQRSEELPLRAAMTHEEMAQRIGSSRETVTRLLSELKKKRLIRLDGATLVIRDRTGLEALAV